MSTNTVDGLYELIRGASPALAGDAEPELRLVGPGIRVLALRTPTLPPAAHTNVYLVGPDEGPWAIVDPGSPYPDQEAFLNKAIGDRGVSVVLLTHHHGDHVGGAIAVSKQFGAPIAAHKHTAARLAKFGITQILEDGDRVADLTCVFTPGHADGHLCFERDGYVIAGDMVAGIGTILIDPSEGDMALYLRSLEKLLARPQHTLLPAHGPAIPDGHGKLGDYIKHRLMREAKVAAALVGESSVTELVERAYADTPRAIWPIAERSLLAHLGKLAGEGRAREVSPGRWAAL